MSVQVIDRKRVVGDRSEHHARTVGDDRWVVSFLPGRTLTLEQAVAAVQFAEFVCDAAEYARSLGLTTREAVHYVLAEPLWKAESTRRTAPPPKTAARQTAARTPRRWR